MTEELKNQDLKNLEVLAKEHLYMLNSNKSKSGKYGIEQLQFSGYQELLCILGSLIKVCIMALDNKEFSNAKPVVEPDVHIKTVLELVVQLIPFEEGAFLDKISELLLRKEETT